MRQKLSAAGAPADLIQTVYALGYRLKALPLEAQNQSRRDPLLLEQSQKQRISSVLIETWERFKPDALSQVAVLEQAAATVLQVGSSCSNELRQQAITEAHKLAGLSCQRSGCDA